MPETWTMTVHAGGPERLGVHPTGAWLIVALLQPLSGASPRANWYRNCSGRSCGVSESHVHKVGFFAYPPIKYIPEIMSA